MFRALIYGVLTLLAGASGILAGLVGAYWTCGLSAVLMLVFAAKWLDAVEDDHDDADSRDW